MLQTDRWCMGGNHLGTSDPNITAIILTTDLLSSPMLQDVGFDLKALYGLGLRSLTTTGPEGHETQGVLWGTRSVEKPAPLAGHSSLGLGIRGVHCSLFPGNPGGEEAHVPPADLAGVKTALRDEDSAGSFEGPGELLEARLNLSVEVADPLFEEAPLLCGQHADDPGEAGEAEGVRPQPQAQPSLPLHTGPSQNLAAKIAVETELCKVQFSRRHPICINPSDCRL